MSSTSAKCPTLKQHSIKTGKAKTGKADLLHASIEYLLAHAKLERTVSRAPGLGRP
jgi:hypothetical protein